jgi:transcription elongation factor Elf1
MQVLDLFNTKFERDLTEGAVDNTIARLIEPLSKRAADIRTQLRSNNLKGAQIQALEKEYEELVNQRLAIIRGDAPKQEVDEVEGGIGQDLVTPQQRVQQSAPQKQTPVQKVGSTVKHAANWLAGKGGPGKEGPTYEGADDIADRGEYDQEGDMAKDNLHTIRREAEELERILGDNDNLPEWVQDKLANVKGMITAVSEYMQTQHEREHEEATGEEGVTLDEMYGPVGSKGLMNGNFAAFLKAQKSKQPLDLSIGGDAFRLTPAMMDVMLQKYNADKAAADAAYERDDPKKREIKMVAIDNYRAFGYPDLMKKFIDSIKSKVPADQQTDAGDQLPLIEKEAPKKKIRDTVVSREIQKARSEYPSADSDFEAFAHKAMDTDRKQDQLIQSLSLVNKDLRNKIDQVAGQSTTREPFTPPAEVPQAAAPAAMAPSDTAEPAEPSTPTTQVNITPTASTAPTEPAAATAPTATTTPAKSKKAKKTTYRQIGQAPRRRQATAQLADPRTIDVDTFSVPGDISQPEFDFTNVKEGKMGEIDAMRQDLEGMSERQFYVAYGMSKAAFQQRYRTLLKPAEPGYTNENVDDDDWEEDEGDFVNDPTVHAQVKQQPLPDQVLRQIQQNPGMRADIIAAYKRKQGINEGQISKQAEEAMFKRILVKHRPLLREFGVEKVARAIEDVAYNISNIQTINKRELETWVGQVAQILGATPVNEGWSDKHNPVPYGVYINGRQWKEFATDDHARAVANKLMAKLKAEGGNKKVTIAPSESYMKSLKETDQIRLGDVQPGTPGYDAWRKSTHKTVQPGDKPQPAGKGDYDWTEKQKIMPKVLPEAGSPAQQAAIAISMKKAGKKPKSVDEDFNLERIGHAECPVCHNNDLDWDEDTQTVVCKGCRSEFEASGKQIKQDIAEDYGSWIVYDPETKQIKKRFKTHTAGKSYARTHGLGFASSEYYFDNVKQQAVEEAQTDYQKRRQ